MAYTEVYVDPAIAGDSGTGTSGDPYGDLQYALNTKARDTTNGDRFNIKAGTAEVLAAALTLATYGTPTDAAPLVLQGYTSAAGDGGIGEISGNNAYTIIASNPNYVHLIDLEMHSAGDNTLCYVLDACVIARCEFHRGASSPSNKVLLQTRSSSLVIDCYVHDAGATNTGTLINITGSSTVYGCYLTGKCSIALSVAGGMAINNIVNPTGGTGINIAQSGTTVINNTVFATSPDTSRHGIYTQASTYHRITILNNVVEGFSASSNTGVNTQSRNALLGYNAAYNNTTNFSNTGEKTLLNLGNDDALAGSPFVNAAGADFDINGTVTNVTEDSWPVTWPGVSIATTPKADRGAVQAGAGAGGGMGGIFGSIVR